MLHKPITISLSPNTQSDDVRRALYALSRPWRWKEGVATRAVERWFNNYFGVDTSVSFNSGRSALLAILTAFGIGAGDEVLVQAFTCVAVPNSVLWAGATPVYVDIDEVYNMDPVDIERKITKKTKALIVQHTFGIVANMDAIIGLARKHRCLVIEDCAHSLGAFYKGEKVGSLGDAAFFSFGRDKVISSVWGGIAIINAKCQIPNAKSILREFRQKFSYPSVFWIFGQLLHPIAFAAILATYNIYIGKLLLVLLQWLRVLSFPVEPTEKSGGKPSLHPARYPNALAQLLLLQLEKLDRYNQTRSAIAAYYYSRLQKDRQVTIAPLVPGGVYLRFPMLVKNPDRVRDQAKRAGILLGNWYHHVIDPTGVDMAAIGYQYGSCPRAEAYGATCINLPTRISQESAARVISLLVSL